jgi:hypothetical protein
MVFVLVLLYHLLLVGGLALASGSLSTVEILMLGALIALGAAALIETELLIEPKRRSRGRGRAIG